MEQLSENPYDMDFNILHRLKQNYPSKVVIASIMGLATCMFPLSIAGLCLAIKEENNGNSNGRTKAAKYIGIAGIILFMFFFVVGIINGFND